VTAILQKSGLHRAVVYDILERLVEKGLVSQIVSEKKKFFEAANPSRLKEMLKEKENKLDLILPNLLDMANFGSKLDVKTYKGKEGIKNVFEDILKESPKEWLSIGSSGETSKLLPYFLEHFHKARIKNGTKVRGLMIISRNSEKRKEDLSRLKLTELRFLPKEFKTPSVMNLYANKIALYSSTEENVPFIILIENKEMAKSFKEYFECMWKVSK
jgi:sugar-specific transcriptional regulator TrmB